MQRVRTVKQNEMRENEGVISKFERKLSVKREGAEVLYKEFQQKLVAVGVKLGRYKNWAQHYRQSRLFELNQKGLFNKLEGTKRESVIPDAEESTCFWSDI